MKLQRIQLRPVAAAAVLACASTGALAEWPTDESWVGLEYFYPTIGSTARLDSNNGSRGVTVNFEQDLDLADRKGTPYFTLGTRLGERWRIQFEYYTLNRNGTKTIGRQIDWGDTTFPVGATLESKFDSTIYRLTGGYSFIRTTEAELGFGFGFHTTDFKTQLSGQGTGAATGFGFQRENHNTFVPLPTIGLYGTYVFNPQFAFRGRVDWLSLNYGDYDGSLVNWLGAFDWRFAKNWVTGLGYRYVNYKVGVSKSDFNGQVDYNFKGPTIYIWANW
jgi:hypothetical protein